MKTFLRNFRHRKISAKASNAARDLGIQVEASENGVVKMKKYGLRAAIGFTILGAIIGISVGFEAPGLGQPITIVVATVLGEACFGCIALTVYFVMNRRAHQREKLWRDAKLDNEQGLTLAKALELKRRYLSQISNALDDIEIDNFKSAIEALLKHIDEYIDEQ